MSTHAARSSAPRRRARRGALPPPEGSDDSLAPELDEDGTAEWAEMSSRYTFDPSIVHALRIRGLTLTEWARRGGVVIATASSAVHGHEVNLTTAWRLTRVLDAAPVVPALERWALVPASPQQRPKRGSRINQARRGRSAPGIGSESARARCRGHRDASQGWHCGAGCQRSESATTGNAP
jgi:hypothetical protein